MTQSKKYTTVLFDLDGTLTNPELGITNCVKYAFEKLGADYGSLDLTRFIGPPLLDSFAGVLNSEERAKQAVTLYRERFSTVGIFENEVYDGVPQMLESLKAAGAALVLATSKPEVFANRILAHFELDRYFSAVAGATLDDSRSDKGDVISYAVQTVGFDPAAAVMVGDRKHDLIGAQSCKIDAVGVLYGFGSEAELAAFPHEYLAPTVSGLKSFLQSRLSANL